MAELQVAQTALFTALAWLVPVGLALLAIGAAHEAQAELVAATTLIALAAALGGYLVCGFAFQFGGVAHVSDLAGLHGLTAEWSPLDTSWGPGWGLVGLRGFLLQGAAYHTDAYLLFASQLPAVVTTVLVTLLALCTHVRRVLLLPMGLLVSGLLYPLLGNWVWGGGWLARLGQNVELGHGFVDAGGSATVFLLGTLASLATFLILKPKRTPEPGPAALPPIHFPLFVVLGALLSIAGWPGLVLSNPLSRGSVPAPLALVNLAMAAAGGSLLVSLYTWFVTSQPNALAIARGAVAGLVAASAACPFVPAGAALLIGSVAGLLMVLTLYLWEQVLRLQDPSASVAVFGVPAVWGTLALAIFADGRWGAGWNGVGVKEYLDTVGQGISGLLLASGYQSAGPGQFQAQVTGLAAVLAVGLLLPWLLVKASLWIKSAGQARTAAPVPPEPADAPEDGQVDDLTTSDGESPPCEEPSPAADTFPLQPLDPPDEHAGSKTPSRRRKRTYPSA